MIKYVYIATEDGQEYYTYYWCNSDYEAIDRAAEQYPNNVTIGIISRDEYESEAIESE